MVMMPSMHGIAMEGDGDMMVMMSSMASDGSEYQDNGARGMVAEVHQWQ